MADHWPVGSSPVDVYQSARGEALTTQSIADARLTESSKRPALVWHHQCVGPQKPGSRTDQRSADNSDAATTRSEAMSSSWR